MLKIESRIKRLALNYFLILFNFKNKEDIFIARGSKVKSIVSIGKGTRINGPIVIKGSGNVIIGNYCALADGIRLITANHNINYLNLQHGLQKKIGLKTYSSKKGCIIIEDNAWIGDAAVILPEVRIGEGAVVGAGSVVTKDVPPYCVYAGNPAKFIKKRFSDQLIEIIQKLNLWEWPLERMKENREIFDQDISIAEDKIIDRLSKLAENRK